MLIPSSASHWSYNSVVWALKVAKLNSQCGKVDFFQLSRIVTHRLKKRDACEERQKTRTFYGQRQEKRIKYELGFNDKNKSTRNVQGHEPASYRNIVCTCETERA